MASACPFTAASIDRLHQVHHYPVPYDAIIDTRFLKA
jgi:hypothetical protein